MIRKTITISAFVLGLTLLVSCSQNKIQESADDSCTGDTCTVEDINNNTTPSNNQIANPASVHCERQGGKSEIRTAADGSQTGYCLFDNNSECEEWAFMKGECQKTENINTDNPDIQACTKADGAISNREECGEQVNTCILKDGTVCPLDQMATKECEEGVIVEWGEACRDENTTTDNADTTADTNTAECLSDDDCANDEICNISRPSKMGPDGPIYGKESGDSKCHKLCKTNQDCLDDQTCQRTEIVTGDLADYYYICL